METTFDNVSSAAGEDKGKFGITFSDQDLAYAFGGESPNLQLVYDFFFHFGTKSASEQCDICSQVAKLVIQNSPPPPAAELAGTVEIVPK